MLKFKNFFCKHKKIVLGSGTTIIMALLLIFFGSGILPDSAQADPPVTITFTDANFEACVRTALAIAEPTAITDVNAQTIITLDCSNQGISDLTGLEYFTALTSLNLSVNNLTSVNLSANTALTELYLAQNDLTTINISANTDLSVLYLSNNSLTSIDLSNNTALTELYIATNSLDSIDVSTNTSLVALNLSVNNLTTIDVSSNTALAELLLSTNPLNLTTIDYLDALIEDGINVTYDIYCGDGSIDESVGETCDDSNNTASDGCTAGCLLEEEEGDEGPTVTSVGIFTDRIIVNFSEAVRGDYATDCSNYIVNDEELECGFGGDTPAAGNSGYSEPYVDFMSDYLTIRDLDLSGTVSFEITETNNITDWDSNSLEPYSIEFEALELILPEISSLSSDSGAIGDELTIEGENFGTTVVPGDDNHKVFFEGGYSPTLGPLPAVEADYTGAVWSDTSITIKVPTGAASGVIRVMTDGVYSDNSYEVYFDVAGNLTFQVFYDDTDHPMPDGDAENIRLALGDMTGMHSLSTDDEEMTYNATENTFTVTNVSTNGWVWVYDNSGQHVNSNGSSANLTSTQEFIMNEAAYSISGTITLGTTCTEEGQNTAITIYAYGTVINDWYSYVSPQPLFYTTDSNCQADYILGVSTGGTYNITSYLSYTGDDQASSPFLTPDAQSVNVTANLDNIDITYSSALYKVMGQVSKPAGAISSSDKDMLWVFAYMPNSNKNTGTQVEDDGSFTLYVDAGIWKVGVGGGLPYPIEKTITINDTFLMSDYTAGVIEYVIAPPTDFIEGYVKDNLENGISKVSVYAWCEGGSGGGSKVTNSNGYFKMYVPACDNYRVSGYSWEYGQLTDQTGVQVTADIHPTVNFTVSGVTISGEISKNASPLTQTNVYVTEGRWGNYLGSGLTDETGNYSFKVRTGDNRWIHVMQPTGGEIYTAELGTISEDITEDINITVVSITVNVSPGTDVSNAFFSFYGEAGGAWSNTNVSSDVSYKQYLLELPQPNSGTAIYYLNGYIEGYGSIYSDNYLELDSEGNITETNGTANDGIFEYSLTGFYEVSGEIDGDNIDGAYVWASGSNGYSGDIVENGEFSFKLRDGLYSIGINKPSYGGSMQTITVDGENLVVEGLTLTAPDATLTGTVYLPDGETPISNVWISVYNNTGGWFGANTDANGEYSIDLVSGDYMMSAGYECYYYNGQQITAPAEDLNITLTLADGCTTSMISSPITPKDGGVVKDDTTTVTIPGNALGTDTNAGTVDVKSVENVPRTSSSRVVGTAREITAKDSDEQNITTLAEAITLSFNLTQAEVEDSGATTIDDVMQMTIGYWDETTNNWTTIDDTAVTIFPATATTVEELDDALAVTLTGTVGHLSLFAPIFPINDDAPETPTNVEAEAGYELVTLSWTASAGATKYYIYQKVGDTYPYLDETTETSYEVSDLTNDTTYYFKVSALNVADNESAASSAVNATPVEPSSGAVAPRRNYSAADPVVPTPETVVTNTVTEKTEALTVKPTTENAEAPKTTADVENIRTEITLAEAQPVKPPERSLEKEVTAIKNFVSLTKSIPQSTETWKVIDYLAYGSTPTTKAMTEKQRRDSLNDYKLIYGKLPQAENDWLNMAKITQGQTPEKVPSRETAATKIFSKIFNKAADLQKAVDTDFVNTIAYLRKVDVRDLEKEKQGLVKFVKSFKKLPNDSLSWAIVRALAYFSGQ